MFDKDFEKIVNTNVNKIMSNAPKDSIGKNGRFKPGTVVRVDRLPKKYYVVKEWLNYRDQYVFECGEYGYPEETYAYAFNKSLRS